MKNMTGEQYARGKYITLQVREAGPLMEFLMKEMSGISRNRVKDLLQGHAIMVDRKLVTQYDHMLSPGQTVLVSRHKRSTELLNKYVKIIYEDKDLIVIEKAEGILFDMGYSDFRVRMRGDAALVQIAKDQHARAMAEEKVIIEAIGGLYSSVSIDPQPR